MGLQGTSLILLGTSLLGSEPAWRSRVASQSPKSLFWASEAGGLAAPCCHSSYEALQGLAPSLFSSQHPFRFSVILCAGSLWVVALDVWVLQLGFNGSSASVKSFLLLLGKKKRGTLFLFHVLLKRTLCTGRGWELREQQLLRTSHAFYFPLNSVK